MNESLVNMYYVLENLSIGVSSSPRKGEYKILFTICSALHVPNSEPLGKVLIINWKRLLSLNILFYLVNRCTQVSLRVII